MTSRNTVPELPSTNAKRAENPVQMRMSPGCSGAAITDLFGRAQSLKDEYLNAKPWPHIVVNNGFPEELLDSIAAEIADLDVGSIAVGGQRKLKICCAAEIKLPWIGNFKFMHHDSINGAGRGAAIISEVADHNRC